MALNDGLCPRGAPAVINAFAVMGIFVAIFAVAAFNLFADRDPDNFGTFSRSLFSMFQARHTSHPSHLPINLQHTSFPGLFHL